MSTSAKRPGLSHPAVIAVVLVLLAAVVVLNVRTFGSGRSGPRRANVAAEAQQSGGVPGDLDRILERSASAGMNTTGGWGEAPRVSRDPFNGKVTKRHLPTAASAAPQKTKPKPRRPGELVCTAVMLGGRRPTAWINESSGGVGDRIRGWRVTAIDADGARLCNDQGREITLLVDGGGDGNTKYRVVTGEGGN